MFTFLRLVHLIETLAVRCTGVLLVVRSITMCLLVVQTDPIFEVWFLDNRDIVRWVAAESIVDTQMQ